MTARSIGSVHVITEATLPGLLSLRIFANNTARDAYVEMGEYFGGTYVTGDSWAAESR